MLQGKVVHGNHLGRTLGFPTANIELIHNREKLPETGVYACRVTLHNKQLPAVANLGYRPTTNGKDISFEVHILDFTGDLYGETLAVELLNKIREEKKFPDFEALVSQILEDIKEVKILFSRGF